MDHLFTTSIVRLARRITWIAWVLLVGAVATFIWAIAFTKGVEALINALLISLLGFLLPSGFVFWVAWAIDRADLPSDQGVPSERGAAGSTPGDLARWLRYGFAAAAVLTALLARGLLTPVLGYAAPYSVFYLAVAATAWFGGLGAATLAIMLSAVAAWYFFVPPAWSFALEQTGDLVGMGLFLAIAGATAAMTSALRSSQRRAQSLLADLRARQAAVEESEARFRVVADEVPAMIWMTDASNACVYVNRGAVSFSGRPTAQHLGSDWLVGIHPDDLQRVRERVGQATTAREPFAIEYRLLRHDGVYRTLRDEGRPRFDSSRGFMGYIGVAVDITGREGEGTSHRPAAQTDSEP